MIAFSRYQIGGNEHKKNLCSHRVYTLYSNGLFKTCNRGMAIDLLKTGQWHDKTKYQPNEEVLTYEKDRQLRLRLWNDGFQSQKASDREKSGHEPYQLDSTDSSGTEHCGQTVRARSTIGEVTKKRGRPKKSG